MWLAAVWRQMGAPENVRLVELGPGRGTIDARRAAGGASVVPGFPRRDRAASGRDQPGAAAACSSSALEALDVPVLWHAALDDVAGGPEHHHRQRVHRCAAGASGGQAGRWLARARRRSRRRRQSALRRRRASRCRTSRPALPRGLRQSPDGSIFEWRPDRIALEIGRRVRIRRRGADRRLRSRQAGLGDTLQAVAGHAYADPLARAGRGRSHRPCRFRGAGAKRGKHRRRVHGPHSAARFPAAGSASTSARPRSRPARRATRRCEIELAAGAPDRDWRAGHGRVVQGACHRRPESSVPLPGFDDAAMMIEADTLALDRHPPRLLHARRRRFRAASMRASMAASARTTTAAHVAENRARMAAARRRRAEPLSDRLPDPLAAGRGRRRRRGRREAGPAPTPSSRACGRSRSASPPPIADRSCLPTRRPASSAPRMPAGAARSRGVVEATVEAMERLGAERGHIRAALGPMIRQPITKSAPISSPALTPKIRPAHRFFAPAARDGHAMFDLAGYIGARLTPGRHPPCRGPRSLHLCRSRSGFSASAAPPIAAKPTTAATSTPSR